MPLNVTSDVVYDDPRFPQADHPSNKARRNKVILNSAIQREEQKIGGLDPSSQGLLFCCSPYLNWALQINSLDDKYGTVLCINFCPIPHLSNNLDHHLLGAQQVPTIDNHAQDHTEYITREGTKLFLWYDNRTYVLQIESRLIFLRLLSHSYDFWFG